jgi:hypothetical protein
VEEGKQEDDVVKVRVHPDEETRLRVATLKLFLGESEEERVETIQVR